MKNKETLEKLRTYQIGVIRSVIASRQGRLGTYLADATDRERLADTDGLAYEEYYESPLTIRYDGLCHNVISLEFCEDGLTPVCLMDGGDDFPLPLENLSCDTLQGIVEWLEEYDFIPSAEAAPQTTSDLTADFVECSLPEYPTRYDVFRLGELQNFLDGHESPEFGLNRDEAAAERDRLQLRIYAEAITAFMKRQPAALPGNVSLRDYAEALVDIAYEAGRRKFRPSDNSRDTAATLIAWGDEFSRQHERCKPDGEGVPRRDLPIHRRETAKRSEQGRSECGVRHRLSEPYGSRKTRIRYCDDYGRRSAGVGRTDGRLLLREQQVQRRSAYGLRRFRIEAPGHDQSEITRHFTYCQIRPQP
ncbi:MAG: hypothetical protein ACLSH3_14715 [Alistipes finegoldii]